MQDEISNNQIMQYQNYDIITEGDIMPTLASPNAEMDLSFYQTKDTLLDPEKYKSFIKNCEARFRASKEYKSYKAYLMSLGVATHCQYFGNIEADETVDVELHHNILTLFDDFVMICEHVLNTVGHISSFDLIQLMIQEHQDNRIPCSFLSVTAHEIVTNDPNAYFPPKYIWGKWWELISKYRYGVTYEIAQKLISYINKYQNEFPPSLVINQQEQIATYAYYNQYGIPEDQCKLIPDQLAYSQQKEIE